MYNLVLFWNSSCQISKPQFFKCVMCGHSYPLSIKLQTYHLTELLSKTRKLPSQVFAAVISTRVCSVIWLPLATFRSRVDQCKVVGTSVIVKWKSQIRSLWRHSFSGSACRTKLTLQAKPYLQQLVKTKHKPCGTHWLKAQISNPAGQFMRLI